MTTCSRTCDAFGACQSRTPPCEACTGVWRHQWDRPDLFDPFAPKALDAYHPITTNSDGTCPHTHGTPAATPRTWPDADPWDWIDGVLDAAKPIGTAFVVITCACALAGWVVGKFF